MSEAPVAEREEKQASSNWRPYHWKENSKENSYDEYINSSGDIPEVIYDPEERSNEENETTLRDFITQFQDSITAEVSREYQPVYDPSLDQTPRPVLLREPLGRQGQAIKAVAFSLQHNLGTFIVGEMGSGKTFVSIAAARMAGMKRVLICCPPHMTTKWKKEIEETLPKENQHAVIIKTLPQLWKIHHEWREKRDKTLFVIINRENAKRGCEWKPAVIPAGRHKKDPVCCYHCGNVPDETNQRKLRQGEKAVCNFCYREITPREQETEQSHVALCPSCYEPVTTEEGMPRTVGEIQKVPKDKAKKLKCTECKEKLWQVKEKPEKTILKNGKDILVKRKAKGALADYIKNRMRRFFDLFVGDEIHEYKARDSAQGVSAGNMAGAARRSIALTGTLAGGYADTLFYLLYRFSPPFRKEYKHDDGGLWHRLYGFSEKTTRYKESKETEYISDGARSSRRIAKKLSVRKLPGILPSALFHFLPQSAFIRLDEVSQDLPRYSETLISIPMDQDQGKEYERLYSVLQERLIEALMQGSQRLLGVYLQSLLAWPDACYRKERVWDPQAEEVIIELEAMPEDRRYPKEKALKELVLKEKEAGRRCLIYATHTGKRDLTGRLKEILEEEGIKTAVLLSDTVKTEKRREWIEDQGAGIDALICNPRLVQTGLDLLDFPTIIWHEIDYSVYTTRQASRRSWRPGQKEEVKVYFLTYEKTMQARALKLIAEKAQSSLAIEGELPEEGLSTYGEGEGTLVIELARQIVAGSREEDPAREVKSREIEEALGKSLKNLAQENQDLILNQEAWGKEESWVITPTKTVVLDLPELNKSREASILLASEDAALLASENGETDLEQSVAVMERVKPEDSGQPVFRVKPKLDNQKFEPGRFEQGRFDF